MEPKKNNSERMRPILQAMERSIDTARRNRVGQAPQSPPPTPLAPLRAEMPRPVLTIPLPDHTIADPIAFNDQGTPRLKARPKHFDSAIVNPFEKTPYRSQAG